MFDNDEENLDYDVDNIINQIKNQGKILKKVEKEKPDLRKEDLEKFVIDNASSIVQDSVEMVQALKTEVMAGGDSKMVEAVSELVKAVTGAIDALSKIKMAEDRINSQRELKVMDIEARRELGSDEPKGLTYSRQEILDKIMANSKLKLEQPPIDV